MASFTKEERQARKDYAKNRSILDIAESLGMELVRSGRDYRWKQHDSMVLTPESNLWNWFSKHKGGDTIALVQEIKEISFNQAIDFINDGNYQEATVQAEQKEPFSNYLEPYEKEFSTGRDYLRNIRGLSDETIDYFYNQGAISQANAKIGDEIVPVIIFKTMDRNGQMIGGNLQGILENRELYPKHGYFKGIMRNSNGLNGFAVDIGRPERLVFAESPIDLMSYYELHQTQLENVRLVSMDGLKESIIGTNLVRLESELQGRRIADNWLTEDSHPLDEAIQNGYFSDGKHENVITLAVDNDEAGRIFISDLQEKGVVLTVDIPAEKNGEVKQDWNDILKNSKSQKDNSRLAQSRRKLDRLYTELDDNIQSAYEHQSLTNGQPMNDKKNGSRFMKRQRQIEDRVFSKMDEITEQEERVQRLEERRERKELGLNRQGNGLDMSVQNIPRIREEIEKARKGESTFGSETIRRYEKELAQLEQIQEKANSVKIQPSAQAIIDEGLVSQWAKRPTTYFVNGLRRVALELNNDGYFEVSSVSRFQPSTPESKEVVDKLLEGQGAQLKLSTQNVIDGTFRQETPEPEGKRWLNENWDNITFSVQPTNQIEVGEDVSEEVDNENQDQDIEKAPDSDQEQNNSNAGEFHRTSDFLGEQTPRTASQPVVDEPQPEFPVIAQGYFTTQKAYVSNIKPGYHIAKKKDLANLNRFAPTLQSTAKWYLEELADSKIHYFFKSDEGQLDKLEVNFQKKNFAHLAGISPERQSMEESLYDFAKNGGGEYPNIQVSNALRSKMKVLPLLPEILEVDSFVFNDLSSVEKFTNLDLSQAITPEDSDLLVLFKNTEVDGVVPGSLMEVSGKLTDTLRTLDSRIVLGIYRERDGIVEPISIHDDVSEELQEEMLENLKETQAETDIEDNQSINADSKDIVSSDSDMQYGFTGVLDAVYNVGEIPLEQAPKEYQDSWERYYQFSEKLGGDFDAIVEKARQENLLDIKSDFYKEYQTDKIYNEKYHVRVNWAENHDKGPTLSFSNETQFGLIKDYESFVKELYQANNDYYQAHLDSVSNPNPYIPVTKVSFDLYAPGGRLLHERYRYEVAEETESISDIVRDSISADDKAAIKSIDDMVLKELGILANPSIKIPEKEIDNLTSNNETNNRTEQTKANVDNLTDYSNPKITVKVGIADRVKEIMSEKREKGRSSVSDFSETFEEGVNSKNNLSPLERKLDASQTVVNNLKETFDYKVASAEELSKKGLDAIRAYTRDPKDLKDFLDFISKFPKYSPRNTALIHEQWPGANAVATYKQWQQLGERLGISKDDVIPSTAVYTNKKTGEVNEVKQEGLSVAAGQKAQIRLFKPWLQEMIPVLDENGQQIMNEQGNPKYKPYKYATKEEREAVKNGSLEKREFPVRDPETGAPRYSPFYVFELAQTNIRHESLPKLMPNRKYNFDLDEVKTHEVLMGLNDYATKLGISVEKSDGLGNRKGFFSIDSQSITLNKNNTKSEMIEVFIHELAHASLHNPKFDHFYKEELPKHVKELEAEMTSYITSKHFGLDTSEQSIPYMASWTNNLSKMSDKELDDSMNRVHRTSKKMITAVEGWTRPLEQKMSKSQDLGPDLGFSEGIRL